MVTRRAKAYSSFGSVV